MEMKETFEMKSNSASQLIDHRIYFDNAATTAMDKEVVEAMLPYMTNHFGNPSSIYSFGRETRMAIEHSRKTVAKLLGVKPGSIFFIHCFIGDCGLWHIQHLLIQLILSTCQ